MKKLAHPDEGAVKSILDFYSKHGREPSTRREFCRIAENALPYQTLFIGWHCGEVSACGLDPDGDLAHICPLPVPVMLDLLMLDLLRWAREIGADALRCATALGIDVWLHYTDLEITWGSENEAEPSWAMLMRAIDIALGARRE